MNNSFEKIDSLEDNLKKIIDKKLSEGIKFTEAAKQALVELDINNEKIRDNYFRKVRDHYEKIGKGDWPFKVSRQQMIREAKMKELREGEIV
jgi:hypothetical protein